jgi:hypothetical protein
VPIAVDDAFLESESSWVKEIQRSRQIGDFTRWSERDSYEVALNSILRELTESAAAAKAG